MGEIVGISSFESEGIEADGIAVISDPDAEAAGGLLIDDAEATGISVVSWIAEGEGAGSSGDFLPRGVAIFEITIWEEFSQTRLPKKA